MRDHLPPEAAELIRECGHLPLALSMIGAMLRGKPRAYWEHVANFCAVPISPRSGPSFPAILMRTCCAPAQLSMIEKQYLERYLREKAGLPRLSLFYMR
jgi:hypothetical protein